MMKHSESLNNRKIKLLWRSRRGMYELDLMLHNYVYTNYASLDENTVLLFETLLTYPDTTLYEWFYCGKQPKDPSLAELVARVKRDIHKKHQ